MESTSPGVELAAPAPRRIEGTQRAGGAVSRYLATNLRRDLLAGVTVAAISLPQAMAYALIAGVSPRFGLYSAIVVTAIASVFGSSSHLINGPTNAISLVVFSALAFFDPEARADAYEAMFLLAIMVGSIQILIAVFRLGDLTRYVSEAVVIGFMAGAGFLVALGQVSNLLGVPDRGSGHQPVIERLWITLRAAHGVNHRSLAIGLATVAIVVLARRVCLRFRWPRLDMLVALVLAACACSELGWTHPRADGTTLVAVIGSVPSSLPSPHVPEIRLAWTRELAGSAMAIAILGLLEALAIAKSIANETGQALDYNRQCLAEGLANLGGGFFQCLPGSGSLTRSAINHQSGAATRASGVVAAAVVAAAVTVLAPLARFIPKPALAGLLMVTAWRLVDRRRLLYAVRASRYDAGLVVVTALSAIFLSVEFSILIGVGLSILLFVPRAARFKMTELVLTGDRVVRARDGAESPCRWVVIGDLEGELFFGAAMELEQHFDALRARVAAGARVVVLRLRRTRNPDLVCLERLEHFARGLEGQGVTVILTGVGEDVARTMRNLRFGDWLPDEQVFPTVPGAPGGSTANGVRAAYRCLADEDRAACAHCRRLGTTPATGDVYYVV
jgi:SulP family sulfate permease